MHQLYMCTRFLPHRGISTLVLLISPCEQVCLNTIGSFQCSCRKGFHLKSGNSSCADVNECLKAAISSSSICSNNSECTNTHGSYMCVCAPGYDLINGTCKRMLYSLNHQDTCIITMKFNFFFWFLGFQEKESTPLQVVPKIALKNLYNFTLTSMNVTVSMHNSFILLYMDVRSYAFLFLDQFNDEREQLFRETTASVINTVLSTFAL